MMQNKEKASHSQLALPEPDPFVHWKLVEKLMSHYGSIFFA